MDETVDSSEASFLEVINESPWYATHVDNPTMLTWHQCLFSCSTFFSNVCMVVCYVKFLPIYTTAAELFYYINDHISGKPYCSVCHLYPFKWQPRLGSLLVKDIASETESMHCVILREMLASKKLSTGLYNILKIVMKIIKNLKYILLTHFCSCSSYTQKWDEFVKVDWW